MESASALRLLSGNQRHGVWAFSIIPTTCTHCCHHPHHATKSTVDQTRPHCQMMSASGRYLKISVRLRWSMRVTEGFQMWMCLHHRFPSSFASCLSLTTSSGSSRKMVMRHAMAMLDANDQLSGAESDVEVPLTPASVDSGIHFEMGGNSDANDNDANEYSDDRSEARSAGIAVSTSCGVFWIGRRQCQQRLHHQRS